LPSSVRWAESLVGNSNCCWPVRDPVRRADRSSTKASLAGTASLGRGIGESTWRPYSTSVASTGGIPTDKSSVSNRACQEMQSERPDRDDRSEESVLLVGRVIGGLEDPSGESPHPIVIDKLPADRYLSVDL